MEKEVVTVLKKTLEKEETVTFAHLFGSTARGEQGPLSDIDVVFFHNTVSGYYAE